MCYRFFPDKKEKTISLLITEADHLLLFFLYQHFYEITLFILSYQQMTSMPHQQSYKFLSSPFHFPYHI